MVKCHARYATRSAELGVEKKTKKQRLYTWNGNIPATRPSAFSARTLDSATMENKSDRRFPFSLHTLCLHCWLRPLQNRIQHSWDDVKVDLEDDESIVDDMEDAMRSQSIGIYIIITGPWLLLLLLSDALADVLACQSNHKQKENSAQIDLCGKKMAASDLIVDRSSIKWSIPAMSVVFDGQIESQSSKRKRISPYRRLRHGRRVLLQGTQEKLERYSVCGIGWHFYILFCSGDLSRSFLCFGSDIDQSATRQGALTRHTHTSRGEIKTGRVEGQRAAPPILPRPAPCRSVVLAVVLWVWLRDQLCSWQTAPPSFLPHYLTTTIDETDIGLFHKSFVPLVPFV